MTIYINDLGIVNALGSGKQRVLEGLLSGDRAGMQDAGPLLTGRSSLAGVVRESLRALPGTVSEFDCRNNRLLATALDEISPGVDDAIERYGRDRIAVVIGTSTSGIAESEESRAQLARTGSIPATFNYRQQEIGTAAEFAARYLGLTGVRYTISTACSSSAKAFAAAARLVRAGRCDAAIAGGSDSLCKMTLNGFDALESLAPDACNPFSLNRRGINIGEGACVGLISSQPAEMALLGAGESSDAYHMAAPDPEGTAPEAALRAALAQAGLDPADVDYVNLHGTATPRNDAMEGRVVDRVFPAGVACSSTKPMIGHTLGAAGAQELGFCWLLLASANEERLLPAHFWDGERDPDIPQINLIGPKVRWHKGVAVSNTFGFGGSNASLVIGRAS